MTDFSGDAMISGSTGSSRADADRAWWSEPDPVELFAAGLELALRQLRVEVAGLRAERDGLRLEVEGLRAKLAIAHEQLASRDSLSDTVRELQAAVARVTAGQATGYGIPVAPVFGAPHAPGPVERPEMSQPLPQPEVAAIVIEPVAPMPEPIVIEPVVATPPAQPEPTLEPAAAPVTIPSPPSAIEQLEAMGLWPPKPGAPVTPPPPPAAVLEAETAAFAPPAEGTVPPAEPAPPREAEPAPRRRVDEPVVNWDRMSTRRTPVVLEDERQRIDVPELEQRKRSTLRKLTTALLSGVGGLVVVTVLLVSVGPRLLPYQTYFVRSGSMEPAISTGAMVVLTQVDGSRLEPGDIITFKNPDNESMLVTHRIIEIENTDQGRVFVTKGDANANADSWRVPATGTGWKYAFDVPVIGYVFGYLGTPQARLALLVVPAAILGLLALVDIWKPKDQKR